MTQFSDFHTGWSINKIIFLTVIFFDDKKQAPQKQKLWKMFIYKTLGAMLKFLSDSSVIKLRKVVFTIIYMVGINRMLYSITCIYIGNIQKSSN